MLIVGTGGHAMDSFDVIHQLDKHHDIQFFNNVQPEFEFTNPYFQNFRIIRTLENLENHFKDDPYFILGLGNPEDRDSLDELMKKHGGTPQNLISKYATLGSINNTIGDSVSIMNGVTVTINTTIGDGVLLNTNATITHDCNIESYVEIGPGVTIAGACSIKHHAFIGTGATILPNITIGEHAVVAAGAVVIKDVAPYTMVAGNPAIVKKRTK